MQTHCICVPQCTIGCGDGGDDVVCLADEDGIAEIELQSKGHGNTWIPGILFERLLLLNPHRASTAQWMPGCCCPPKAPMGEDTQHWREVALESYACQCGDHPFCSADESGVGTAVMADMDFKRCGEPPMCFDKIFARVLCTRERKRERDNNNTMTCIS